VRVLGPLVRKGGRADPGDQAVAVEKNDAVW